MKMSKMFLAAVTVMLLSGPLSTHANIIYDWSGTCQVGCTGQATFHIVTTDVYVPGTELRGSQFGPPSHPDSDPPPVILEALYTDSQLTYDFTHQGFFIDFDLLLPFPNPASAGFIVLTQDELLSNAIGAWKFSAQVLPGQCDPPGISFCNHVATGTGGLWTRVPEASTLVLLGVGLAGLALSRKKRSA